MPSLWVLPIKGRRVGEEECLVLMEGLRAAQNLGNYRALKTDIPTF